MKLSFCTLGCPDWTLEQIAYNGAAYGFDGVELRIDGNKHVDPSFDAAKRLSIRKMFADSGLCIVCLSGYTQFCGDDSSALEENCEALLQNVLLATDLGAPFVRTFLGGPFTDMGAAVLRKCCDKAAEAGVTVLMEIHDALSTGKQAAEICESVGSGGFGILWDMHHSMSEKPEETWNYLKNKIRHMHIKDADSHNNICHIGQGVLPVAEVVRVLEENSYDGYFSYEWEKMWIPELDIPEIALPKYVEFMRGLSGSSC